MNTKNMWIVISVAFWVGILLFSAPVRAIDMSEGKWEHTGEMKMEGMTGVPAMPFTSTQCMTRKDLVPSSSNKDANCTIFDQRIAGSKVIWKAKCIEKGSVSESEGEITYRGTTYSGTQKIKITEKGGQVMNMMMQMKGRRIGDCN